MTVVTTYQELADAVRRDETIIRLEGEAKYFYEKKLGDAVGGGVLGAIPGLMFGGPLGAVFGAAVGATVSHQLNASDYNQRDIARFLICYYRKSSTGVTYIELTHR